MYSRYGGALKCGEISFFAKIDPPAICYLQTIKTRLRPF